MAKLLLRFLPFWLFLIFYKFGGSLHYSLLSPMGDSVFPLWLVGLLIGGGSLVQVVLDVPAGYLLDRFGYRRLLLVATGVFVIAAFCYTFGLTWVTYILSVLISTFSWLFIGPGINAYLLSQAPHAAAGRFLSLRDVATSIGSAVSTAVLPLVVVLTPPIIGLLVAALLVIALALLVFSPKDRRLTVPLPVHPEHHQYIRRHALFECLGEIRRLNPAATMLLLLTLSGSIFYGAIWFVVPLVIAREPQSSLMAYGLGAFDLAIVVLGYALGKLADRFNRRALVFFGLLLFSLAGVFVGFHVGWFFIFLGFLATVGDETAGLSLWSWLHQLDRDHRRDGVVSGIINLSEDVGWAIGPIFAGLAFVPLGPSWTIVAGAVPICVTWLIYLGFLRAHRRAPEAQHSVPKKPHRSRSRR